MSINVWESCSLIIASVVHISRKLLKNRFLKTISCYRRKDIYAVMIFLIQNGLALRALRKSHGHATWLNQPYHRFLALLDAVPTLESPNCIDCFKLLLHQHNPVTVGHKRHENIG